MAPTLLTPPVPPPPPVPPRHPLGNGRHRRRRARAAWTPQPPRARWLRWASLLMAAVAATLVGMLSVLGGLIAYDPLHDIGMTATSPRLSPWWPLLIYGPWLVGSLSVLRAALHQRQSQHSWAVVFTFSGLAVMLCVMQAPPGPLDVALAALPPASALVAFHQVVRQLTLIHPPRHAAIPRQRTLAGGPHSRL